MMQMYTVTFAGIDQMDVPIVVEAKDRKDALMKAIREVPKIVRNDPTTPIWYCHDGDMEEDYRVHCDSDTPFAKWLQRNNYIHDDRHNGAGGYFKLISIERMSQPRTLFSIRRYIHRDAIPKSRLVPTTTDVIEGIDEMPIDDAIGKLRDAYLATHKQPNDLRIANDQEVFDWIVRYRTYIIEVTDGEVESLNSIRFIGFIRMIQNPQPFTMMLEHSIREGDIEAKYLSDELNRLSAKYGQMFECSSDREVPRLPKKRYKRKHKRKSKATKNKRKR